MLNNVTFSLLTLSCIIFVLKNIEEYYYTQINTTIYTYILELIKFAHKSKMY